MDATPFTAEYVSRLAAGDSATEEHFTRHFGALLLLKLRSRLRSPQLVDDVRQETFLRVLRSLRVPGSLQKPERLAAYVNAVCNNVLFETFRSEGRASQFPEDAPDPEDPSPGPESELVSDERKRLVRRVLDEMPAKDRDLLRMVFLEERDKAEIAKKFNVDSEYLRVLLHRAKARFRAHLERHEAAV